MQTIKAKLAVIAGGTIFSLLFMATLFHFSSEMMAELQEARVKAIEVRADMLTLRRNEKDFLMRYDLKYQEKFDNNYAVIEQDVALLHQSLQNFDLDSGKADQLKQALKSYAQHFRQVVQISQTIGLDENSGLQGKLRNAVHSVEQSLQTLSDDHLTAYMLQLRKDEKDFLQRTELKYQTRFETNFERFLTELQASSLNSATQQQIQDKMLLYRQSFLQLVTAFKQKGLNPKSGLRGTMRDTVHKTETQLNEILAEAEQLLSQKARIIDKTVLAVALILAAVIGGALLLVKRQITRPLNLAVNRMQEIAQGDGDLTVRLPVKGQSELDDLSKAFNTFVSKIAGVIGEVSQQAQQIASNAEEAATIAEQNSCGAEQQQRDSQQAAAAVSQMVATIDSTTSNIQSAAQAAQNARNDAVQGNQHVQQAVNSVQHLAAEVSQAAQDISALSADSEKIQAVLEVIRGIAEQTNLLALNAAIEAARAGESGRGFAVVADEVRTLAQRTQDSTQDIQDTTEQLKVSVDKVMQVISASNQSAETSVKRIKQAGQAFDQITHSITTISEMNEQIASGAEQESATVKELQHNIHSVSDVAVESALGSKASAQSSEQLASIAAKMNDLVQQFKM